ncbi:phage tail fiber protein [Zophobihabitans entericus]|uniref:Uncharacterized protein n=1 Tax=Zophobihabitans entericus TaxID=1635327 RepID=A0A6G9I9W6_9GAMM|nr:prophage tail fiber N-terminal domain-containing protein [Zophobihabitans entericus]QIQ21028.1 hypothetical protein IPMB12_04635 [Zophobihabitans entericus]
MAKISGYLKDGSGLPVKNCSIVLTATKTTDSVIKKVESYTTTQDGYYEIDAQVGDYDVTLLVNGRLPKKVGIIQVLKDSTDSTLNDYLLNSVENEDAVELVPILENLKNEAQQLAIRAENAVSEIKEVSLILDAPLDGEQYARQDGQWSKIEKDNIERSTIESVNGKSDKDITLTAADVKALPYEDGKVIEPVKFIKSVEAWSILLQDKGYAIYQGYSGIGVSRISEKVSTFETSRVNGWFSATTSAIGFPEGFGNDQYVSTIASSADGINTHYLCFPNYGETPNLVLIKGRRTPTTSAVSAVVLTSANTIVDSNGFIKQASPVVRLINPLDQATANDNPQLGWTKVENGYVNLESKGVTIKYINIGHYEIHDSLGFAKSGWYIQTPEDANGNKKIFVEYSVDDKNVITVKSFKKLFKDGEFIAGEPVDIPGGRWIDIRLEMPKTEDAVEDNLDEENTIQ